MSRDEARKVFLELKKYYPDAKTLKNAEALAAYGDVLMRYDYSAVLDSVRDYVAQSPFFPHVADLVRGLAPADDAPRSRAWMTKYARDPSDERPSVSRYARAHGLPWPEAKKQMEETKCSTSESTPASTARSPC